MEHKRKKMKNNKIKNYPDSPAVRALKANFFKTFKSQVVPNKKKYGKRHRRENKVM